MEHCLEGFRDEICIPYLDDVIVFSKAFEQHVDHVRQGLRRILSSKLKPGKCKLFQREVNYFGQIVSSEGYRLDPTKVRAVTTLKESTPTTVGEVRKLLGLLGYYRRYIQNFARIARPLFDLLQAPPAEKTKSTNKISKPKNSTFIKTNCVARTTSKRS